MSQVRFDVVFHGRLLPGFGTEEVTDRLCRMFGLDRAAAMGILSASRTVLKQHLTAETAETYAAALRQAGLEVTLEARVEREGCGGGTGGGGSDAGEGEGTGHPGRGPERLPFSFHGTGSAYFRIWIVNLMLSIVTLGIYSAWAKVRRKRYFYLHTQLAGTGFAYLADPVKILVGRIVVVGVFGLSSLASQIHPFLSLGFSIAFLFFFPWIIVRSLAFNARNSSYRNIRFVFHGRVWGAVKAYILWPAAAVLTLGLLGPYALYQQHRYVITGSAYGSTSFTFDVEPRAYYRMFMGLLPPLLVAIAALAGAAFLMPLLLFVPLAGLYLFVMAWYAVSTTNISYNAARLSSHAFEAQLKVLEYLKILVVNTLLTVLTLGLFHPWAKVRIARYRAEKMAFLASGSLDDFLAAEEKKVASLGEEAADFLDFDFGL